jgi:hypothetical protein
MIYHKGLYLSYQTDRQPNWVRAKTARLSNLPVLSPRVYIRTWQTVFKLLIDYTNIENVGCIVQVIISP